MSTTPAPRPVAPCRRELWPLHACTRDSGLGAHRTDASLRRGPVLTRLDDEHYLGFEGIPNPPDDYVASLGASPYTWPAIHNNMEDIDYCV